ncbi:MAG: LCCL domain-containing protein [Candidatus Sericytochromatia bacterium]
MSYRTICASLCVALLVACAPSQTPVTTTPSPAATAAPANTASGNPGNGSSLGSVVVDAEVSGNLNNFRDQLNKEVVLQVTGRTDRSVWGSGIYTDDSDVGTAAVHAGLVKPGEVGIVRVRILEGKPSYTASVSNGVTSQAYGSWGGSFEFVRNTAAPIVLPASSTYTATDPIPASQPIYTNPGSLTAYRGIEQILHFEVQASTSGLVWGNQIYTDDSILAAAALHAGLLKEGETGIVTVRILPGQDSYTGSTSNGVTSHDYASWGGSFSFVGPARYINNTASIHVSRPAAQ